MLKTKNQTKPNSQNNTDYMNTNPKSQKKQKRLNLKEDGEASKWSGTGFAKGTSNPTSQELIEGANLGLGIEGLLGLLIES